MWVCVSVKRIGQFTCRYAVWKPSQPAKQNIIFNNENRQPIPVWNLLLLLLYLCHCFNRKQGLSYNYSYDLPRFPVCFQHRVLMCSLYSFNCLTIEFVCLYLFVLYKKKDHQFYCLHFTSVYCFYQYVVFRYNTIANK